MKKLIIFHSVSVFFLLFLSGCAAWTLPDGNAPDDLTGPSGAGRMTPEAAESAMASALTRFVLMRGLAPAGFAIQPDEPAEQRFFVSLDRNLFYRTSDPKHARFLIVSRRADRSWELQLKDGESGAVLWSKKLEW